MKRAQYVEGIKWCLEVENETVPTRTRDDGKGVIRKEDRSTRGCVATEVVHCMVKGGYKFVLSIHKMLFFRVATAVGETHCLDLLATSKARQATFCEPELSA